MNLSHRSLVVVLTLSLALAGCDDKGAQFLLFLSAIFGVPAGIYALFKWGERVEGERADGRQRERNYRKALDLVKRCRECVVIGEELEEWVETKRVGTSERPELEERDLKIAILMLLAYFRGLGIILHIEVLYRKRRLSIYTDDYGYPVDTQWLAEKRYFCEKVLAPEVLSSARALLGDSWRMFSADVVQFVTLDWHSGDDDDWLDCIDQRLDNLAHVFDAKHPTILYDEAMSGEEYEAFVAALLREQGWLTTLTPRTGDHGADIIAETGGSRVACQCKKYTERKVNNKSVQEAYTAASLYECDYAAVVSNSSFTPSARQAADKLGVFLLHHDELDQLALWVTGNQQLGNQQLTGCSASDYPEDDASA